MNNLNFFDAFCTVGTSLRSGAGDPHTARELLEDMDRTGMAESMVLDSLSREFHPAAGNRRVLQTVASHPRLHPAWAAIPHGERGEQPHSEDMLSLMKKHRVGALFLFPSQYCHSLDEWAVDAFCDPFERERVPVFVNFNDSRRMLMDACRWDELVGFCSRHPSLPVVLSEWRIRRTNRMLYRAMDACPNLHIELSGFWLYRGIEYLVRNWGSERLIFGSNWPHLNHACTAAAVAMAEIGEDDKRLIAGGNLRRLINWCVPQRKEAFRLPEPSDEFALFARTGRRSEQMTFLDCHGHLGGYSPEYHIPDSDIGSSIKEMDRMGIERCFVFSFSVVHGDECYGNDTVAAAVKAHPDKFIGFAGINPHRGRDRILEELRRCREMGLRGIKLIPQYQAFPAEDPLIDLCCKWANENRWVILNHDWGSCENLGRLLVQFPEAHFINGHAAPRFGDLARKHDNLWICTCPVHTPRSCENLVQSAGADRVMFGSDLQDLPVSWGLGPVLQAELEAADKKRILHDNMRALLEGLHS